MADGAFNLAAGKDGMHSENSDDETCGNIINGGTIDVTGGSTFDYDGAAQVSGGTIIVNGTQVNSIPSQMMGGGRNGGFGKGGRSYG